MHKQAKVEAIFYSSGYKCVVLLTPRGHRCGYVGVPPKDILFKMDYMDTKIPLDFKPSITKMPITDNNFIQAITWDKKTLNLALLTNVHGGITYSALSHHTTYPSNQFDPLWYFGFDCIHNRDAIDIEAIAQWNPDIIKYLSCLQTSGIVRTTSYVVNECKNLAKQLRTISNDLTYYNSTIRN